MLNRKEKVLSNEGIEIGDSHLALDRAAVGVALVAGDSKLMVDLAHGLDRELQHLSQQLLEKPLELGADPAAWVHLLKEPSALASLEQALGRNAALVGLLRLAMEFQEPQGT